MFAIRPEEFAVVTEAVNLVADMGRVGVVRRLKLDRFSQTETRSSWRRCWADRSTRPGRR